MPPQVKENLTFHFTQAVHEVLKHALDWRECTGVDPDRLADPTVVEEARAGRSRATALGVRIPMPTPLKLKATVLAGSRIEFTAPGLPEGTLGRNLRRSV